MIYIIYISFNIDMSQSVILMWCVSTHCKLTYAYKVQKFIIIYNYYVTNFTLQHDVCSEYNYKVT